MTQGKPLETLIGLLNLEQIEENIFRGHSPTDEHRIRVFGGQVAGQALVAAGRTVSAQRSVHSLHSYFLRPGDPAIPIVYLVDRIRDGRSFTTRRVVAVQRGEAIFQLSASFQKPESGVEHQRTMPQVPEPESLPTYAEAYAPIAAEMGEWYTRPRPFEYRFVDKPNIGQADSSHEPRQRVWLRADGTLGDDPLLHACVIAYASDLTLLESVVMPHNAFLGNKQRALASLDHAVWFHNAGRADEWFLYDQESPIATGARGLARGLMYSQDGKLIASVVQEGLVRLAH